MLFSLPATSVTRFRRGLTLIELVVVMAILAALAGILIPTLSGMLTRAHTSSSATNIGEVAKLMQTYQTQYFAYPNNLDSLVTGATGTPASYLVGGGADLTTVTLNQGGSDLLEPLNHVGITSVTQMVEPSANTSTGNYRWSPTFYPYSVPTGTTTTPPTAALAANSVLMGLTGAAAAREFGAPPAATYVMFGLGKYSTLSRSMLEAPTHFSDAPLAAPHLAYARYLVVFQLTDGTTNNLPLERARLVGIVALHDDGVASIGSHLQEYYTAN